MGDLGSRRRPAPPGAQPDGRLDSWKEIAAYLNRTPRTVQRWEIEEHLPVHRLRHEKQWTVYALKHELDQWFESRRDELHGEARGPIPATGRFKRPDRRMVYWVALLVFAVAGAVLGWYFVQRSARVSTYPDPIQLTALPGEEWHAKLSPDGSKVAFSWKPLDSDNFGLYVKHIDTDALVAFADGPLTEGGGGEWSPDGNWLAYLRLLPSGKFEVLRKSASGGAEQKLGELIGPSSETEYKATLGPCLTWHPDGNHLIVMGKEKRAEPFALFVVSIAAKSIRRLTSPPEEVLADSGPAVNRNGDWLTFQRVHASGRVDLYLQRLTPDIRASGEPVRLETGAPHNHCPVWTRNDQDLVFASAASSVYEPRLYRMRAFGKGDPVQLPFTGDNAWFPTISRDSGRFVYSRLIFNGNLWRITLNEDGAADGQPKLFLPSTRLDLQPSYSPDGQRVAFVSTRSRGFRDVFVCHRDGSRLQKLTETGSAQTSAPSWSPDDRWIAFASTLDGNSGIYVVNSTGGEPVRFSAGSADDTTPRWSPDGKWLYFTSNRSGPWQVWKKPFSGGAAVQLTREGGGGAYPSPDGKYVYYAKSGFGPRTIWRVPVEGGKEEEVLNSSAGVVEYAVGRRGLYFLSTPAVDGRRRLWVHNPSTGAQQIIGSFVTGTSNISCNCEQWANHGLAVSPDEKHAIFGVLDSLESDLMLVENFH